MSISDRICLAYDLTQRGGAIDSNVGAVDSSSHLEEFVICARTLLTLS